MWCVFSKFVLCFTELLQQLWSINELLMIHDKNVCQLDVWYSRSLSRKRKFSLNHHFMWGAVFIWWTCSDAWMKNCVQKTKHSESMHIIKLMSWNLFRMTEITFKSDLSSLLIWHLAKASSLGPVQYLGRKGIRHFGQNPSLTH